MPSGVDSPAALEKIYKDRVQPIMHETRRALPRSTCGFGADWSRAICEASAGAAKSNAKTRVCK